MGPSCKSGLGLFRKTVPTEVILIMSIVGRLLPVDLGLSEAVCEIDAPNRWALGES